MVRNQTVLYQQSRELYVHCKTVKNFHATSKKSQQWPRLNFMGQIRA